MRINLVAAIAAASALVAAGCSGSGGDEPEAAADRREPAEETAATTTTTNAAQVAAAEALLRSAWLTEQDHGIPEDPDYADQTGLAIPTFGYCDLPHHGDDQRVARTQQWWETSQANGQSGVLSVGNEVVLYRGDGADQFLAAFAALPETCPRETLDDESIVVIESAVTPPGLPEGAVALTADRGWPSNGFVLDGCYVAIPQGDVVALLYVSGDASIDVAALTADLAGVLAERTGQVSEQLA